MSRKLTHKQEKFAVHVAEGKNYSESYRIAYDASKMKPETINKKAFELINNGQITARIEALKKQLADKLIWTKEQSVKALIGVIEHPDRASDITAAVKELNAMHGFNTPKQFEQLGPDGKALGAPVFILDGKPINPNEIGW